MRSVYGLLTVFVAVLISVYAYNRFIAKDGKTIANLGEPDVKKS